MGLESAIASCRQTTPTCSLQLFSLDTSIAGQEVYGMAIQNILTSGSERNFQMIQVQLVCQESVS